MKALRPQVLSPKNWKNFRFPLGIIHAIVQKPIKNRLSVPYFKQILQCKRNVSQGLRISHQDTLNDNRDTGACPCGSGAGSGACPCGSGAGSGAGSAVEAGVEAGVEAPARLSWSSSWSSMWTWTSRSSFLSAGRSSWVLSRVAKAHID